MKEILLSTDIGSDADDAMAVLAMLNSSMNLRGIYTINGDVLSRACISKKLVDLAGKPIEIAIGESQPMGGEVSPYSCYEECYVDERFVDEEQTDKNSDIVLKSPERIGIKPNGLELLAKRLKESPKVVFSIAPMTLLAKLLEKFPNACRNIENLYVMGCNFKEGYQEHNIRYDIPAARRVFNSQIPIVVIPANLCSQYHMPTENLENIKSKAGKYVKEMARALLGIKTSLELNHSQIKQLMEQRLAMDKRYVQEEQDRRELMKNIEMPRSILANLMDPYFAAYTPEQYFQQYRKLINHLKNPKFNYTCGNIFALMLESFVPTALPVADVYVPYCYLRSDRIKLEPTNIVIDEQGNSKKEKGSKHLVVAELDFEDFGRFLKDFLI